MVITHVIFSPWAKRRKLKFQTIAFRIFKSHYSALKSHSSVLSTYNQRWNGSKKPRTGVTWSNGRGIMVGAGHLRPYTECVVRAPGRSYRGQGCNLVPQPNIVSVLLYFSFMAGCIYMHVFLLPTVISSVHYYCMHYISYMNYAWSDDYLLGGLDLGCSSYIGCKGGNITCTRPHVTSLLIVVQSNTNIFFYTRGPLATPLLWCPTLT